MNPKWVEMHNTASDWFEELKKESTYKLYEKLKEKVK